MIVFGRTEGFMEFGARSTQATGLATLYKLPEVGDICGMGFAVAVPLKHIANRNQEMRRQVQHSYVLEMWSAVGERSSFGRLQLLRRAYRLAARRGVVSIIA